MKRLRRQINQKVLVLSNVTLKWQLLRWKRGTETNQNHIREDV